MLNKKVKSLLFIFLILFCIAAVNAESIDDNIDIESMNTVNIESGTDLAVIDEETTVASTAGNFSDLNNTINKETKNNITLDKDYIYNSSTDSEFKNGIVINRTITIDGAGHIIDGNYSVRIFNVTNGTLTLKNIKLINGNATYGGAIYNNGTLNVINVTFTNNNASANGGAIFGSSKVNMTIADSTFINNTANGTGGAVCNSIGNITITNSIFTENSVNYHGGAIYSNHNVTVINTTFNKNKAGRFGGAISSNSMITTINSTFTNNTAGKQGGAIESTEDSFAINSNFTQNSAVLGGAISSENGKVTITGSNFNQNNATSGGAVFCNETIANNSNFTQNTAEIGGAIFTINLTATNSNFNQNNVTTIGGAIFSVFANINGSTFTENNAERRGGAVYSTYATISNSIFDKNNAKEYDGGAIYIDNRTLEVVNSIFTNNTAGNQGGAIYSANTTIENSNFTQNNATSGGAIYNTNKLTVADSKFDENSATKNGGALYSSNDLTVSNSTFNNNTAATNGGAIYSTNGNATITESEFNNNNASKGGAIYYTNTKASSSPNVSLTVENSTFDLNKGLGDDIYTSYNTNVLNNTYTKDSYANIYADGIIINGTVVSVLDNKTYHVANAGSQFKANATVTVDGASVAGYTVVITDGENSYKTTYQGNGVYETNSYITANFTTKHYSAIVNGDENSTAYTVKNGTVVNLKEIELIVEDLIKYYGNDGKLFIKLTDSEGNPIAHQNVTITINGKTYNRTTDENGTVLMNINLDVGVYEATVTYGNLTKNATVAILPTISGNDIVKFYRNGTQYYATFLDENGNPLANTNVTFNINGVFYTRETNENGTARLNINLNPGEYIITAFNSVNNESYSNVIEVLNVIESENLEMTTQSRLPFEATILGDEGKPLANAKVVFNVHGRIYEKMTDENGVARLNINLLAGEYIITTMYNGLSKSNTIVVNNI